MAGVGTRTVVVSLRDGRVGSVANVGTHTVVVSLRHGRVWVHGGCRYPHRGRESKTWQGVDPWRVSVPAQGSRV
jgi:hypothetical protein